MKFLKYLDAFKNTGKIMEGIKNKLFKKEHVEAEAAYRMFLCNKCEYIDIDGKDCLVPGTQPCCSQCGCSLEFKTRSLSSSCPKGYWKALMNEEEEEALNKMLNDD
jgi:hypothetical protein